MSLVQVLIPAAGSGTRFGGAVMKQYLPICGRPVLAHSISAFNFHPAVAGITVVLAENDQMFDATVGSLFADINTVQGGDTRAESVRNGLQSIKDKHPETEWVLVHDAARPCLPPDCLDQLLDKGREDQDGALLAVPVGDTLKRSDEDSCSVSTEDRRGLWSAQTPQLFPLDALCAAIDTAREAGHHLTDEASAMEFAGARPKLIMGSAANIKITHPGDLMIAEAWLSRAQKTRLQRDE